jgi:hypothetical protein
MTLLSIDYTGLMRDLAVPLVGAHVGSVLLVAVAERYERQVPNCSLVNFVQSGATYLFDLASAVGAGQEDRTVVAWTVGSIELLTEAGPARANGSARWNGKPQRPLVPSTSVT